MMRDLTLLMTARWAINSMILNQMPMFSALSATARRVSQTNFWASSLISTQLLMRAKRGARGKAATKIVMKPNWRTKNLISLELSAVASPVYPSPNIPGTSLHSPQVCSPLPPASHWAHPGWPMITSPYLLTTHHVWQANLLSMPPSFQHGN